MIPIEKLKESPCLDPTTSHISPTESAFLRERFQRYLQNPLISENPENAQIIEGLMVVAMDVCAGKKTLADLETLQNQVIDLREYQFLLTSYEGMNGWNFIRFLADPKGKMEQIQHYRQRRYG